MLRAAPAAFDEDERIEQLLLPIDAPSWLAPGEGCERWQNGPHMFGVVDHIDLLKDLAS